MVTTHQSRQRPAISFEAWTSVGSPISVAYDQGYMEGLAAAAGEVARLRAELAEIRRNET